MAPAKTESKPFTEETLFTSDDPKRNVIPAPYHLSERIRTHFEERLYPSALQALSDILFSGISSSPPAPILLPPHTFLRYVTTLLAHPFFTTQYRKRHTPSPPPELAHTLLTRIIHTVRPGPANLSRAWECTKNAPRARRNRTDNVDRDRSPTSDEHLSGELANEESLFSQTDDIWAIIGWAFNCSVAHPKRWKYWKRVLDVFILAFEEDWKDNCAGAHDGALLKDAMIVRCLPDGRGSGGYRRVIRAIMANNTGAAKNEFTPVWQDELLVKRPKIKGRAALDAVFGQSESDESDGDEPLRGKTLSEVDDSYRLFARDPENLPDAPTSPTETDSWGGVDALRYRKRFLALLEDVCEHNEFIDSHDLCMEYKDTLLPLTLPSFTLFTTSISPTAPTFRVTLYRVILDAIISTKAPPADDSPLTQDTLVTCYLGYPAKSNSAAENSKVAILLEALTRLLMAGGLLEYTVEMEAARDLGEGERRRRSTSTKKGEVGAKEYREAAEARMKIMVQVLKGRLEG